jgi:hypothetical protein
VVVGRCVDVEELVRWMLDITVFMMWGSLPERVYTRKPIV